jgi:hypothetical protein
MIPQQNKVNAGFMLAFLSVLAMTSCQDDLVECNDKAIIWIVNKTICTPDIEVNGDLLVGDMAILDSISFEADAGIYDIEAKMAFISACENQSVTLDTDCGLSYRFEIN